MAEKQLAYRYDMKKLRHCHPMYRAHHHNLFLWFLFLLSILFFSSPNLSHRRLDVCHTSTHGVALVQISDAVMQVWNVLHAARWKYSTQKIAKNRHLCTIPQLCRVISSQLRHVSTIGKKLVKLQYLLHMPNNMVNFGPLTAEIGSGVLDTPAISTGFASWQRYCTAVK